MTLLSLTDMPSVRWLLGLKSDAGQKIEQYHLAYATAWPLYALALLLLGAAAWFFFCYLRDGSRPTWWVKTPLLVLRLLAIVALVLMLFQPTLRLRQVDKVRPSVILLVDTSESMGFHDPRLPALRAQHEAVGMGVSAADVVTQTRLQRANALLNHADLLNDLSKKYNVRLYGFATEPRPVALPTDERKRATYRFDLAPEAKNGGSTQMGAALRRAQEDLAGQPIAGALVVSDGGNNLGEDPILVADGAKQAHIPVSAIGLGDPTKTKDIAILSVLADDVVRVNNTVTVYASLSQRGYAGKTITVSLKRNGAAFLQQTIRLAPDDQKQEVHYTFVPTAPGRFFYTVEATVLPGEVSADNNKKAFPPQTVISKKLKVLYVEAEPRYEFRYLKNAIMRDTSLDFGCLLLSGDDVNSGGEGNFLVKGGFPTDEKALFDYDIIVLGDVPRDYFNEAQLQAIRRFVEDRGASLLVIAGDQHMPREFAGTPLEAVLPVSISSTATPFQTEDPFPWQLTPEGKRSPVMQLEDNDADNDRTWTTLPGMDWVANETRAKPGATVLAVHPTRRNADGPIPLVAYQTFGAGKCYMQLVDETWHWRWRVGDRYFYRYWGQVFRTLTPKELPGNSRFVQINADRNNGNYSLGEKVLLNARLLDAYYHPIKATSAPAILKTEGGQQQSITLQATPGSPGLYTAQFQPERVGRYEVSLNSPANPQAKASAAFVVESLALEKQKPELDETLLKKVAAAGGGKYYAPDEIRQWARTLPNNPLEVHTEQEIEVWDAPGLLLLFLVPLGLEWLIRKRTGLL